MGHHEVVPFITMRNGFPGQNCINQVRIEGSQIRDMYERTLSAFGKLVDFASGDAAADETRELGRELVPGAGTPTICAISA